MKIQPYVERLENTPAYREFAKKHRDAFIIAGFFVLDIETGQSMHQLDYYVPSEKKIAAFNLDKQTTMQLLDMLHGNKAPEKLDTRANIDLDALKGILEEEMKNRNITEEIRKIIAVVQVIDGKKIWNLNCVLSGMGILNAHIEDESKTVLRMEKKSIIDFIRRMPIPAQLPGKEVMQQSAEENEAAVPDSDEKIKKLEQLEKAIELEKEKLSSEVAEKAENSEKKPGKKKKKVQ